MGPHWSDRNRDGLGRATGPCERIADPVGMFELYRRHPYPLCGSLRRGAARPNCSTPGKNTSPTRDRQSLEQSTRPPGLYECRPATPTGTTACCRANGSATLCLSPCGIRPLLGQPLDLRVTILLPSVLLRPALLWITPSRPSLVISTDRHRPVPLGLDTIFLSPRSISNTLHKFQAM